MQRAKRAIAKVGASASSLMGFKLELPAGIKLDRLGERDQVLLEDSVRSFNYLLGLTLDNVRQKGELLMEMRAILARNGYEGVWQRFVVEVLHLSPDTVENWVALAEFAKSEPQLYQELIAYPLRATTYYQIGKVFRSSPEEMRSEIKEYLQSLTPEELAALDPKKVKQAVINLELNHVKINEKAKEILAKTGVEATRSDLKRLQSLNHRAQVAAAQLVAKTPGITLRESITTISQQNRAAYRESKREEPSGELALSDHSIDPQTSVAPKKQMTNPVVYGEWRQLLEKEDDRSLDVVFCELPFRGKWLAYHGHVLFQAIGQKLSKGGIALVTLGQQDLPHLGHYLPPGEDGLKVAWTCVLHRTNGNYPRVLGLNIISGYVPMVILYKSPYRVEHLVSDIQSHSDQPPVISPEWQEFLLQSDSQVYAYHGDPNAPMGFDVKKEKQSLDTLERCLRYYLESYLKEGHHCYHLVLDLERSFGVAARMATVEACLKRRASKLTTAINLSPNAGELPASDALQTVQTPLVSG